MSLKFEFRRGGEDNEHVEAGQVMPEEETAIVRYPTPSNARTLFLTDSKGVQCFFFYHDLLSGTYSPDEGMILLTFRNAIVNLHGKNLGGLYEEIGVQTPKKLFVIESRYELDTEVARPQIREITIAYSL